MLEHLPTDAEKRADDARNLTAFSEFSLLAVRKKVASLLSLIGKGGFFHTYTLHDISHIDAMLRLLDWIVPEQTKDVMTPCDWLLTVLGIYFHDLGMLVPEKEFELRNENQEFLEWLNNLQKVEDGRDFIARTKRMNPEERERFFFQEFVRVGHAKRIRSWIIGRNFRDLQPGLAEIAEEINDLVKALPPRFRDHLGAVCESHHANNLDDQERFPLYSPMGSDRGESVNVQYAAILLRTTDLLHITKDRTPSQTYRLIRFTDPKSVSEWEKQLGTFAVLPKARRIDLNDPETTDINVRADFTDERPFFSLQEYIVYADSEIMQSRRWIEKSRQTADGRDYLFPWRSVKSDVRLEGVPPQKLKFELDRGRLLDLLVGHTLYNDATVAIRELLQNAIDAVRYQHYLEKRDALRAGREALPIGRVKVIWDGEKRTLAIEDNGTGMDLDIIQNHLMKVGASYYNTNQFEAENTDFTPISRFGIGILTCFMVSDDIEIVTVKGSRGYRLRMTSVHADYLLREAQPYGELTSSVSPHGTRVRLILRDSIDLTERSIEEIVRHWIILPECAVEFEERGKPVQRIGYGSAVDALAAFHEKRGLQRRAEDRIEYLTKKHSDEGGKFGSCEFAFAVARQWFPEKAFVARTSDDQPMVCVEGIRVSDDLPWLDEGGRVSVSALLSIRGHRSVRTTVSRSELENDDAYDQIGKLCLTLLFQHVQDEANRIASLPGKPLSQASSAASWLCGILRSGTRGVAKKEFAAARQKLPMVVIEKHGGQAGNNAVSRELICLEELANLEEFWTVESRLVESLGMLAHDLGRELSINGTLTMLAPGFQQLSVFPLLPDARVFLDDFASSHLPSLVKYSRAYRQTAIRWEPTRGHSVHFLRDNIPQHLFKQLMEDRMYSHTRYDIDHFVWAAPLEGDHSDLITCVATRMGIILRPDSKILKEWMIIRNALHHVCQNRSVFELSLALGAASAYRKVRLKESRYFGFSDRGAYIEMWRKGLPVLRQLSKTQGTNEELPEDLSPIDDEQIFDARDYWKERDFDEIGF